MEFKHEGPYLVLILSFMYRTIRQFGPPPLTLKRTWIYALVISNQRTAGSFTFVKPWQFSPPSVMFYFILPIWLCISNATHFPCTNGTMQKVKIWYICPAIPWPCQGIGCVVITDWYIILIGRELTCSRKKAEAWDISTRRVPGHFIEFPLWIVSYMKPGVWLFCGNGFRAFQKG